MVVPSIVSEHPYLRIIPKEGCSRRHTRLQLLVDAEEVIKCSLGPCNVYLILLKLACRIFAGTKQVFGVRHAGNNMLKLYFAPIF